MLFFKKTNSIFLFLFVLQLKSQNSTIKIPVLENNIHNFESLLLQEKYFHTDTVSSNKYLKPLSKTKKYSPIYEGWPANGYSNFYNGSNSKSKFHYLQSISKAKALKEESCEIWTQLNYVGYLYNYRDFTTMTPNLLEVIDIIKKHSPEALILPGKSFEKLGWIMQTLEDYEEALKYLNLAKTHTPINTTAYGNKVNYGNYNYTEGTAPRRNLLIKTI
ncbi:hypothetical protein KCTC52924_03084 [Arenibacter antarcticus]|uniref:Tetratricopeptide repeat-containing protein n=1 Tax=Arenibacter antarcticus TaxID=2040469 RepID=A0ABW5VFD5_9FLAO|nr:hypothetical protein [Arenibacter sp. H213]MCM4166161.1 hypothetical protein [Arenibacter sp. H213]